MIIVDKIKDDDTVRACSMSREMRNAYTVLTGKPEGKRPLGRPRHRWEDNTKVNPLEMGWEIVVAGYCNHGNGLWASSLTR
jgi:hypothetical protein